MFFTEDDYVEKFLPAGNKTLFLQLKKNIHNLKTITIKNRLNQFFTMLIDKTFTVDMLQHQIEMNLNIPRELQKIDFHHKKSQLHDENLFDQIVSPEDEILFVDVITPAMRNCVLRYNDKYYPLHLAADSSVEDFFRKISQAINVDYDRLIHASIMLHFGNQSSSNIDLSQKQLQGAILSQSLFHLVVT